MAKTIPENLNYFLKNALKDVDDGYDYASELNRILHSDECQFTLTFKEIEALKDFAEKVKKLGEINYYTEERIHEIELECFGNKGIAGFLGISTELKPQWPF